MQVWITARLLLLQRIPSKLNFWCCRYDGEESSKELRRWDEELDETRQIYFFKWHSLLSFQKEKQVTPAKLLIKEVEMPKQTEDWKELSTSTEIGQQEKMVRKATGQPVRQDKKDVSQCHLKWLNWMNMLHCSPPRSNPISLSFSGWSSWNRTGMKRKKSWPRIEMLEGVPGPKTCAVLLGRLLVLFLLLIQVRRTSDMNQATSSLISDTTSTCTCTWANRGPGVTSNTKMIKAARTSEGYGERAEPTRQREEMKWHSAKDTNKVTGKKSSFRQTQLKIRHHIRMKVQ